MLRLLGLILGCGVGAGLGWVAARLFTRAVVQDMSAAFVGWLVGSVIATAAYVAELMSESTGGLGAVSFGAPAFVLFSVPIAALLTAVAQVARRRMGHGVNVPVVLGALGAVLAAVWVAATVSVSVG